MTEQPREIFYRTYDLIAARTCPSNREPAAHQAVALDHLHKWYTTQDATNAGGILVLPTGGGKTFTAVRFLCRGPLSDGYKVLWLAHTHHLLEQAIDSFGSIDATAAGPQDGYETGWIIEPKERLQVRVVSGTPGHWPVHKISPADDVVVATLQTITRAYWLAHPQLMNWLDAAPKDLFVVFDEAHHAPAPSYRKFIEALRERCASLFVLGLTATPTYTDEKKQGWLARLFPQGILYQARTQDLMSDAILARPVVEQHQTNFSPDFDEREYQKWKSSYRDIPESIITKLAESRERNSFIARCYVENRERYGKTIIFADRWFQCDQLRELLRAEGVRADVIYTHIDADPGSVAARNRNTRDENARVLAAFRRDELDVLINVRMLTEGTDVPKVNTVFLTRQTTSSILLTQMIGRALRGPRFGGTEEAYIVSFIDQWQHLINWADYTLGSGGIEPIGPERTVRLPLQLISIALVRRLVRQMGSVNVEPQPYLTLMPIGWYLVSFVTIVQGSDDMETVQYLVMVFDNEADRYKQFIAHLQTAAIDAFTDESITLNEHEDIAGQVADWRDQFFGDLEQRVGTDLLTNLLHIARHMAQDEQREPPPFFEFEERTQHNLDLLAGDYISQDLGPKAKHASLQAEYVRDNRYWRIIYPNYRLFKTQYDACENRLLLNPDSTSLPPVIDGGTYPDDGEPSEEVKEQVKARDRYRCLCCGEDNRRTLQIDHIAPRYFGGTNALDNLQTLCSVCNRHKSISEINFRNHCTLETVPSIVFPELDLPAIANADDKEHWEIFLRRSINFFYRCAATDMITIKARGQHFWNWHIYLYHGNDPAWLAPHLYDLLIRIRSRRQEVRRDGPTAITVAAPNMPQVEATV
ncbi:MAG: DEAD/DEAH box helicase family protein [Chloroflexaceae bacterium]